MNRLSYSLWDFYLVLVRNNKKLASHEFFQLIKTAIQDDDSYRLPQKTTDNQNTEKPKSSQVSVSNILSKSSFLTSSQNLNMLITNNNQQNEHNNNAYNQTRIGPASVSKLVILPSNNIIQRPQLKTSSTNDKQNLETFLKQNVLINLNEMKINKVTLFS